MTIGQIMRVLKHADPTAEVVFDFCGIAPTDVDSWRGSYDTPAIGWRPCRRCDDNRTAPTVAQIMERLQQAIDGRTYHGWKGGEYQYGDWQVLMVDNPGECTRTGICGVLIEGESSVVLQTRYRG